MKVIKVGERGDGFIYQRPGSRFWWCAYMLHGVQERETTNEAEENKAKKYLRDRLKQVHADEIGARKFVGPSAEKVTVNELLDDLEANFKIRDKFRPQVKSRFKFMRGDIGELQAKSLTERDIDRWIERLKNTCNRLHHIPEERRPLHHCNEKCKRLAPATINQYTQLLGQALTHGRRKIGEVPKITKLKVDNARQGFFEYGEFLDVLRFLPEELRDYTHFDYLCGWRKGEVSNLQWTMIDYDARLLKLPGCFSKNGKPRKIPLRGELWEIIKRRWQQRKLQMPSGETFLVPYVFYRKHGRGIPGAWFKIGEFRKAWKRACQDAKVPDKIFHDFRRTAARNLVRAGVSEKVAMLITGHRSRSVFDRYNITSDDDLIDAVEKVSAHVSKLAEKDAKRRDEAARFQGAAPDLILRLLNKMDCCRFLFYNC
ncbi:MAG: site-specific integrase [Acidobacteriia bacterium]|nr:site-specific integrase [Terriglobia bacterium]